MNTLPMSRKLQTLAKTNIDQYLIQVRPIQNHEGNYIETFLVSINHLLWLMGNDKNSSVMKNKCRGTTQQAEGAS